MQPAGVDGAREGVGGAAAWQATIAQALRVALKAKNRSGVMALRSLSARIANAEAVPLSTLPPAGALELAPAGLRAAERDRRTLTVAELIALLAEEVAELDRCAAELDRAGGGEAAADLRARRECLTALGLP